MTTKNDDVLIKVEGLHKIYGDFDALNGINEEIHKGEVVVVVGPSGSGKSTFLRSLNLLGGSGSGGHIYFEGVDITDKHVDINKHRQKMGMVFQHFNLFPHKTIKENITLAPDQASGKSKEEADKRAMELWKSRTCREGGFLSIPVIRRSEAENRDRAFPWQWIRM